MPSFIVSSGQLLKSLEQVKGGLGTSNNVPIVQDFLLEVVPGWLHVTTTNLEVRLSTRLEVEAVEKAQLCVPGQLLLDTLRHMADQPATFTIDPNEHGYALLVKSAMSERRIAGEDARGFPAPAEYEIVAEHKIRAGALQRALAKTVDFADPASSYPMWTGVSIRFAPRCLELAASDGMGSLVRYQQKYDSDKVPAHHQVVVPARALKLLVGLLPKNETPAWISITERQFCVAVGDKFQLTCRLIDSAYPLYNTIIPKELPQHFVANRQGLQTSLRGLQGYVNDKTLAACFDFSEGYCALFTDQSGNENEARERLPGDFTGASMKVGFRLPGVLTALGVLDGEEVTIGLNTGQRPAMLMPAEALAGERIQVVLQPLAITL